MRSPCAAQINSQYIIPVVNGSTSPDINNDTDLVEQLEPLVDVAVEDPDPGGGDPPDDDRRRNPETFAEVDRQRRLRAAPHPCRRT